MVSRAIVVVRSGYEHHDDVALNYTQLSLDYQRTNRVKGEDIDYYVVDEYLPEDDFYDSVLVIQAGTIFLWGAYEHFYKSSVEQMPFKLIHLSDTVFVHQPNGKEGRCTFPAKYIYELNTSTPEGFWGSHDRILTSIIDDSNITYLMHNEIPVLENKTNKLVDWAITVSSGFFINCILDWHGFHTKTAVHHIDISKISLQVHRYTIKNWDGKNIAHWMEHLNKQFPNMGLWNRRKFTSEDKRWLRVWENVEKQFGQRWLEHWKSYCELEHHWHRINISEIDSIIPKEGQGMIWWNGALKRLPSNIGKTSNQSWQSAQEFISKLPSDTICYGSDHCDMQFDGVSADIVKSMTSVCNSRETLWL